MTMQRLVQTVCFWVICTALALIAGALLPCIVNSLSFVVGRDGDLAQGVSWTCFFSIFLLCMLAPYIPRGRLEAKGKAVLITGCDTGFGLLTAQKLDALGMHVFAGCYLKDKGGDGAKFLEKTCSKRLKVIQLDVTNDQSVKDAVKFITENLPAGQKGLWGLINNAGTSAFGDIEWSSIDLYKHVADVNLWGVIRTTKECLPLIRRAKGRVVNMASGISRVAVPSRSVYCVTKFGIQGFSDCLRYEMRQWGVKVSIIEPGNYIAGTSIFTKESVASLADSMWGKMSDVVKTDYGREYFDAKVQEMAGYCNAGCTDLTPVTDAYEDALLSERPYIRYNPMSPYWIFRLYIMTHMPTIIGDYIYINRGATAIKRMKQD